MMNFIPCASFGFHLSWLLLTKANPSNTIQATLDTSQSHLATKIIQAAQRSQKSLSRGHGSYDEIAEEEFLKVRLLGPLG